ncbi:MAG: hypothetical protein AAGE94_13710, partial [Acidobacteriota bacterium]
RPLGSPARDTANFLRKLESVGQTSGLTGEEIVALQAAFQKGYGSVEGGQLAVPPEAMRFFRLRTLLSELRNALRDKKQGAATALVEQIYAV